MLYVNKMDEDRIWKWYQIFEQFDASGMKAKEFREMYNLPEKEWQNTLSRIKFISKSNPAYYEFLMSIIPIWVDTLEFKNRADFMKHYNLSYKDFSLAMTHLNYLRVIEKKKAEHGDKPLAVLPIPEKPIDIDSLEFIQVPSIQGALPRPSVLPISASGSPFIEAPTSMTVTQQPEPEVMAKRNDVELVITKGVKVIVAPEVDSMTLIKIIELLKDL